MKPGGGSGGEATPNRGMLWQRHVVAAINGPTHRHGHLTVW